PSTLFAEVLGTFPAEGNVWPDDWFVVRMDPTTHELRTITFTTNNRSNRMFETTCEFSNDVELDGLKIPTHRVFWVTSPFDQELHTWDLADLRFNQLSEDAFFERKGTTLPAASTPPASAAPTAPAAPAADSAKTNAPVHAAKQPAPLPASGRGSAAPATKGGH